jgi:probable phosphoglycerate mutase
MELVLVRHALPERIDDGDGPADPRLTPHGHQQAARVVAALAGEEVDAIYSSPLTRARQTAAPLAEALALPVVVEPGLKEYDSHASYVPVEELRDQGGEHWEALKRGSMGDHIDVEAFRARVVEAVERIAGQHPGGRAVLFAHAGVINAYCGHVAGVSRAIWLAPAYASVTRIGAARDGRRGITSINETAHVRDLLLRSYTAT